MVAFVRCTDRLGATYGRRSNLCLGVLGVYASPMSLMDMDCNKLSSKLGFVHGRRSSLLYLTLPYLTNPILPRSN